MDRLAADEKIAADWVAGLARPTRIDTKIDSRFAKVVAAGSYFPVEREQNSVIWRAFELPLTRVRVLILGQDPYPDPARAAGLSFSTGPGGDVPGSLANIYEEVAVAGFPAPGTGDSPMDHAGRHAAEPRTDPSPRQTVAAETAHPVVVAARCGRHACNPRRGRSSADRRDALGNPCPRHAQAPRPEVAVFASSHPSPISVHRTAGAEPAFRGSDPFGQVNRWFKNRCVEPTLRNCLPMAPSRLA